MRDLIIEKPMMKRALTTSGLLLLLATMNGAEPQGAASEKSEQPKKAGQSGKASARKAKDNNWTEEEWEKDKGRQGWVFPHIDKNADGQVTAGEYAEFQNYKKKHPNWESELKPKAVKSEKAETAQAAKARAIPTFDPGWEEDEFPPHAVSLKTPEEIMTIYKRGEAGRTYVEANDAMSFPKQTDGILRIVGTGHSFTAGGYRTLPSITRAAGFEQPFCLHNGSGGTGSVSYKWEQENGIFRFDGKPVPKLLSAISNAKWEAMIWGPYKADRPKFYTSWIDFCEKYNPGMKYFLMDAWPTLGQVQDQFRRRGNPESESFFTDEVFDQLNAAANQRFAALVNAMRETTDKVYILPTNAAMTEAAKRFNRGELPGVQGLFKVIGGKEFSIWRDQRGHLGPGFERLEGYVFYATIYGKSPELISEPIKFSSWNSNPSFLSDELDKIFREIAWKAVVEHPLSGVADENRNGIGDHLE